MNERKLPFLSSEARAAIRSGLAALGFSRHNSEWDRLGTGEFKEWYGHPSGAEIEVRWPPYNATLDDISPRSET